MAITSFPQAYLACLHKDDEQPDALAGARASVSECAALQTLAPAKVAATLRRQASEAIILGLKSAI